jgi:ankyrin repeat protein
MLMTFHILHNMSTLLKCMIIEKINHISIRFKRCVHRIATEADLSPEPSSSMDTEDALIAAIVKTEEGYNQVLNFLSFCEKFLQDRGSALLCTLALYYLVEVRLKSLAFQKFSKVPMLFAKLLILDEKHALDLYSKPNFARNFPGTTLLVEERKQPRANVETVTNEIQRLDDLLLHEKDLLGIIPLFREKFFEVKELAALILYVLKNGVTPTQLIKNKILHDFIITHFPSLDSPDSKVKQLYAVLGQFDAANDLTTRASRAMAKIVNCSIPILLNGERPEKSQRVSDVAIIDTPFKFTVTKDNFKNIHTLFGNVFLMGALKLFATNQNKALKELLISCINGKEEGGLTIQEISDLIQAAKDTPHLLKSLAAIMGDETIHKLLLASKGATFHLAPYKPDIIKHIEQRDNLQGCGLYLMSNMPDPKDLVNYRKAYIFIKNDPPQLFYASNNDSPKVLALKIDAAAFKRIDTKSIQDELKPLKEQVSDDILNKFWEIITSNEGHTHLQDYIRAVIKSKDNAFDTLGQLIVLLEQCSKNNIEKIEKILYYELLNFAIENTSVQIDEILNVLKCYMPKYSEMIQQRAHDLVKALKKSIEDNMLSKNDFSKDAYGLVEDSWGHGAKALSFLKQLNKNLTSDYPADIYALYCYVVNSLIRNPEIKFNLGDFLNDILSLQNKSTEDRDASVFERAVFEILVGVDHPKIRVDAIALLENNKRWIEKGYGGKTIGSLAVMHCNVGLFKFLLTLGHITISSIDFSTALRSAARAGQFEFAQYLCELSLKHGVDINKADKNGDTPLILAAERGHTEVVGLLLAKKVVEANKADGQYGPISRIWVAIKRLVEVVRSLLPKNVNKANKDGETPLTLAAKKGHKEVVELLLDHVANVSKIDKNDKTSLTLAAKKGHTEEVNKPNKSGDTLLILAVKGGHKEVVELLLNRGADVNKPNKDGYTPLILAAARGHTEIVKLLLDHKADVNEAEATIRRNTPLMRAAEGGHLEIVELLLNNGADVNIVNIFGETPLGNAAGIGNVEMVELLLAQEGVDVNKAKKATLALDSRTPLMEAVYYGHATVVKLLLKKGADVNKAGNGGNSPLMLAVLYGKVEIVELLLDHGADVNKVDYKVDNKYNDTPFTWAVRNGKVEVVRLLLNKADVNKADKYGDSPLMLAYKGRIEDVNLLMELLLEHGADINRANNKGETFFEFALENQWVVTKLFEIAEKSPEVTQAIAKAMTMQTYDDRIILRLMVTQAPIYLAKIFELMESPAIVKAIAALNEMSKREPQNLELQTLKHTYNLQLFQHMSSNAACAKEYKALLHASSPEELQEIYGQGVHLENLKRYIGELLQSPKDLIHNPALELIQNYVACLRDQQLNAALNVFNNYPSQVAKATLIVDLLEKDFTTAMSVLNNQGLMSTCDDDEEADKILRLNARNVLREVVSQLQKRIFHVSEQANITSQEKQFLAQTEFVLPVLIEAKAEGVAGLKNNISKLKNEGKLNDQSETEPSLNPEKEDHCKIAQWERNKTAEQELDKHSFGRSTLLHFSGSSSRDSQPETEREIVITSQPIINF